MGNQELIMGSNEITQIIKGKRTKRQQRPMSPPPPPLPLGLVMSSTTSLSSSPSCSSVEFAEEEDMANCLILLAQGNNNNNNNSNNKNQILELPSEQQTRATNTSKVYVYQCKTCNRCFPSFQALGGHRASHKKPKIAEDNQDKKAICTATNQEHQHQHQDQDRFQEMNTTLSLQIANRVNLCGNSMINMIKSNKVHECSICGAEFSSGQALGGHMRRHRAVVSNSTGANLKRSSLDHDKSQEYSPKKSRNSLQLDLNLPAPQEDDLHQDAKLIRFTSPKEQVLVFTATPNLIDCHY